MAVSDAVRADGLIVLQEKPFNAETALSMLEESITPTSAFYVRSNFAIPAIESGAWSLRIGGTVREPSFTLADLRAESSSEVIVTVECAGNGRTFMRPVPAGTPWNLGAVGTARFRGVRLRTLLERAGLKPDGSEVVFGGMDGGEVSPGRSIRFERSLPLSEALRDDVLIAYEMNGEALTADHGFPARLVVPGYYGMAWVKWLERIEVIDRPFDGHFQVERYIYRNDPDVPQDFPLTRMRPRALITSHATGTAVPRGAVTISGIAWSGTSAIAQVELSQDDGASWNLATLTSDASASRAVGWQGAVAAGADHSRLTIVARATDAQGAVQPLAAVKNELGYGNNAVHRVILDVVQP